MSVKKRVQKGGYFSSCGTKGKRKNKGQDWDFRLETKDGEKITENDEAANNF